MLRRLGRRYERHDDIPHDQHRHASRSVLGDARAGHRAALAGLVGRAPHVRDAQHRRAARRRRRWPPSAARSCSCSTCSRTRPAPDCTSVTRSGFIGTDVFARFKRMTGHNVLHTMGFDAFGLPAEQFAVETGQHPAITTQQNVDHLPPSAAPAGPRPRPAASVSTTDPDVLPVDAVDLHAGLQRLVRPRRATAARPIAALVTEFESGSRSTPDGRPWDSMSSGEQRRPHRRSPPGVRQRGPGQLVPGSRHRRGQRGGHRRRAQRPRQLPGLQAQHAPVDDADHRLRRPPDRRPRRCSTGPTRSRRCSATGSVAATAPTCTSPVDARPATSRSSPPVPTRCSARRSWCSRPSTRSSTR